MYKIKVIRLSKKVKGKKTLKVKCEVPFIDRLKAIKYTIGFSLLFIYRLLSYASF